jgi:hypothetical protein
VRGEAIHPIIYVRGYAMTQAEIEEAVADPYMGFNLGSSKLRQLWDGRVAKYFFESPLVRLLKEHGYHDVYNEGLDCVTDLREGKPGADRPLPYRSIVIYRYYEPSSTELGAGAKPSMERFAGGLDRLILDLRDRLYPDGPKTRLAAEERAAGKPPYDRFRVYLVAHSMGGLVCRAFLQNPAYGSDEARGLVDKLFTYATPHNGIEVAGLGNVPAWLTLYGINTFNRDELARLLALTRRERGGDDVDLVTRFDAARIFNLVGTNPSDYKAAAGLSSVAVGEASDGLVRIRNATTRGRRDGRIFQSPQAFVHRSHSGQYGIVNSEEGYQNLVRFLFGEVRADGFLDIDELTLPAAVQAEVDRGAKVRASYQFEVVVSLRGKTWQLHRRTVGSNSAIFRKFDELFSRWDAKRRVWTPDRGASPMLFTVFLDMAQSQTGTTLAFAVDLRVRVPDYEVNGRFFLKNHYEGSYIFRDRIVLEATPPRKKNQAWRIEYQFESRRDQPAKAATLVSRDGYMTFELPVEQAIPPGIRARLRIEARFWNDWHA